MADSYGEFNIIASTLLELCVDSREKYGRNISV
jgi:hypothetical protein